MLKKKAPSKSDSKPTQYFNFGVGWLNEETESLSCSVDWNKNKKANKGQGYKLYLVPVDDTGEEDPESAIEITKFRVKRNDKGPDAPETAPDFSCYTWK